MVESTSHPTIAASDVTLAGSSNVGMGRPQRDDASHDTLDASQPFEVAPGSFEVTSHCIVMTRRVFNASSHRTLDTSLSTLAAWQRSVRSGQ